MKNVLFTKTFLFNIKQYPPNLLFRKRFYKSSSSIKIKIKFSGLAEAGRESTEILRQMKELSASTKAANQIRKVWNRFDQFMNQFDQLLEQLFRYLLEGFWLVLSWVDQLLVLLFGFKNIFWLVFKRVQLIVQTVVHFWIYLARSMPNFQFNIELQILELY